MGQVDSRYQAVLSARRDALFRCRILCLRPLIPNSAATGARAHLVAFDKNSPDRRSAPGGYANATPSSVMNSRWLIRSPRRRGRAAAAAGPSSAVEFAGATLNLVRSTGDQRAEGRL